MSNLAQGLSFSIATPHFKSSTMGMSEYLLSANACNAALSAALSLTFNLPHLCGLGGDAIIMQSRQGQIDMLNGTGKTAHNQYPESYLTRGLTSTPRRGIYSTMIYGCPSAYDRYVNAHTLDINQITHSLIKHDLSHGLVATDSLSRTVINALNETTPSTRLAQWSHCFTHTHGFEPLHRHTLDALNREGFSSLYTGVLAEQVYNALAACDPSLYTTYDFSDFEPNLPETRTTEFMHATITAHGSNSPWRELFLLLKIYQLSAQDTDVLTPKQFCTAAGLIDALLAAHPLAPADNDETLSQQAAALYEQLKWGDREPVAQSSTPSHTIFMACAEADGTLTGITNSIFTPLGALFEIENTGILLSNRAFSFNGPHWASHFKGSVPAKHTTNCVHVRCRDLEFIVGTSGGPVQSQTLAFIINKIVAEHCPIQTAVASPRYANLGCHPKTQATTYLSESAQADPVFTWTHGLSEKLGVVQLAGINTFNGRVFAAADPRSTGVALAL